jgi:hypothetical protein
MSADQQRRELFENAYNKAVGAPAAAATATNNVYQQQGAAATYQQQHNNQRLSIIHFYAYV